MNGFAFFPTPGLPQGVKHAASFQTICINVPRHLQCLLSQFKAAGGKVFQARLPSNEGFVRALEVATTIASGPNISEAAIFVNASALGSRTLTGDETMFPTKGQTILVMGESAFAKTTDTNFYVIPRPWSGTTILGGTREDGKW